ncbi:MAG: methyltransferase [Nanoarchaeota archaeon]|nr:methyltransferase [Nanoarchaeota archaeon]
MYEPREDSFLLKKHVKKLVSGKVLDVGTGSGIQALAALENTKEVLAVDISEEVVEYCKKKNINVIQSDLFEKIEGKFDWIIFNPPYLPEDPREPEDSKLATTGGKKGDEILKRFLVDAKDYLNENGKILVLISSLTGKAEDLFKDYSWKLLERENLFMEDIEVYLLQNL